VILETNNKSGKVSRLNIFYGWYLVAIAWIMSFLLGGTAVSLYFKPILDEFGWSRAALSLVSAVILLALAVLSPLIGKLIDRFGPRLILLVGVLAQTVSAAVNGLAGNLWHIYVGRFLYEFKPTHGTQVLLNRWFVKYRGRALGIASTGIPLGTLLLSPLAQYLISQWGWRNSLFFWAGVNLVVLLPLMLFVRDRPQEMGLAPDGLRTAAPSLKSSIISRESKSEAYRGFVLSAAMKTAAFWLLCGTQLICGIGCGFMMTHLVIFATDIGYSSMIGAVFLSVVGGGNLIGLLATGYLSDRFRRNRVLSLTHLVRSLSFFIIVIAVLTGSGGLWMIFLAMVLFGLGWFTTAPLAAGLAADLFGYRQMGTILGITFTAHYIGTAIGALGGGVIFTQTGSYLIVFIATGCLECLAAVWAFSIKKPSLQQ
jgi:sugar phosphate permease